VDPRQEVLRLEFGKLQHQVSHITLGVDDEGGNPVEGRFFEQHDRQPTLPAAGHTDDKPMRGQVFGVVEERSFAFTSQAT